MKLKQRISERCKVISTLRSVDAVEQSIFLILLDTAKDEEKVSAVTKVTNMLVQNGWVVADIQMFDYEVIVEYTKLCGPTEVITAMMSCQ